MQCARVHYQYHVTTLVVEIQAETSLYFLPFTSCAARPAPLPPPPSPPPLATMPPPPLVSPVTGSPCGPAFVHASTAHFRDVNGRHLLLRGINLSSSAKSPVGQPGAKLDGFWETAKSGDMSFVGRVLDLTNGVADLHLLRLRNWGFNCLRYVVNWESLEHAGPYVAFSL